MDFNQAMCIVLIYAPEYMPYWMAQEPKPTMDAKFFYWIEHKWAPGQYDGQQVEHCMRCGARKA